MTDPTKPAAPSPRQDPEPCLGCGRPSAIHYDVLGDLVGCPRPSPLPSREEVERAVDAFGNVVDRQDSSAKECAAARAALLSLIPYRSDR